MPGQDTPEKGDKGMFIDVDAISKDIKSRVRMIYVSFLELLRLPGFPA